MRKLIAKELKRLFIETFEEENDFLFEDGNPFLIKIGSTQYYIFLKNISPAYFKNSPDITRVQLPYSSHFFKIFESDIPLLVFGYDVNNDVVVSWDPNTIKDRLNARSNVSLYSRVSLQKHIGENEIKAGYLSNGERIVLFKRKNLLGFFNKQNTLFTKRQLETGILNLDISSDFLVDVSYEKLYAIPDRSLLKHLKPLLENNKVLEAVEYCTKYYNGKYRNMTFKDWFNIVREIYKESNESYRNV